MDGEGLLLWHQESRSVLSMAIPCAAALHPPGGPLLSVSARYVMPNLTLRMVGTSSSMHVSSIRERGGNRGSCCARKIRRQVALRVGRKHVMPEADSLLGSSRRHCHRKERHIRKRQR